MVSAFHEYAKFWISSLAGKAFVKRSMKAHAANARTTLRRTPVHRRVAQGAHYIY